MAGDFDDSEMTRGELVQALRDKNAQLGELVVAVHGFVHSVTMGQENFWKTRLVAMVPFSVALQDAANKFEQEIRAARKSIQEER